MKTGKTPRWVRSLALRPPRDPSEDTHSESLLPLMTSQKFSHCTELNCTESFLSNIALELCWEKSQNNSGTLPSSQKERLSLWLVRHRTQDSVAETKDASWNHRRRDGKAEGWAKILDQAIDNAFVKWLFWPRNYLAENLGIFDCAVNT